MNLLKKRIFWLGMHKVLVQTELPTLREMGYEVFNPPYLSDVLDQSAELNWLPSETTLPNEIYEKLCHYNFFYNQINAEIAEILKEYFDAIIVTINPDWLLSILKVYKKTIIYRTYGGIGLVSESLYMNGSYALIQKHDDFWFVPHCVETASDEHNWLKERIKIAPYWLTDDVFLLKNQWRNKLPKKAEIGLTCPNVSNPYYKDHFKYLKTYFEQRCFRYYGAQLEVNADPNIVGSLPRDQFLNEFLHLSGYLYTYRERNVCYLPPIEMMVLGGPVLYFPGSLLHRYFKHTSPGLVRDEADALRKAKSLIKGDTQLAEEIIASQDDVAKRYSKSYGFPIFSQAMSEMLQKLDSCGTFKVAVSATQPINAQKIKPVLLFAHFTGAYTFSNGEYSSMHGIPRVMRQLVRALTELDIPVVVTAWHNDLINTLGFYSAECGNPNLVSVIAIDELGLGVTSSNNDSNTVESFRSFLNVIIRKFSVLQDIRNRYVKNPGTLTPLESNLIQLYKALVFSRRIQRGLSLKINTSFQLFKNLVAKPIVKPINHGPIPDSNDDQKWRYVIVPHYYLFPEALTAGFAKVLAYIPDYMPHFFKGRDYFPENNSHCQLGHALANIATVVLTNSRFTAEYLPNSSLIVSKDKIVSFPMPLLSMSNDEDAADYRVVDKVFGTKYIFYPTQPHPNKRLDLLIRSWILVNKLNPSLQLKLILTCGDVGQGLMTLVRGEGLESDLHFFPGINDATISWLYKNAVCLAFTSELEGNLPTQLIEALHYRCPVVTMKNPLITSELGKISERLLTAPFADIESFAGYIIYAEQNRAEVLEQQESVFEHIKKANSYDLFLENVHALDSKLGNGNPPGN